MMNAYIENILQNTDFNLREKKVQNTIFSLIRKYCNCPEKNMYLQDIRQVATYFKDQKINFSYNEDNLLRTASFQGEKDFVQWLYSEANLKQIPDMQVQASAPLRFALLNEKFDMVEFLLTDKNLPKSDVNAVYGNLFTMIINNKNKKLVKLFLLQEDIDIKIEHIVGLYQYNIYEQEDMLEFISNNSVKNIFFKTMVQYKSRLENEIHSLLTKKYFTITKEVFETLKFSPEYDELIEKREAYFYLDDKYPPKNNSLTNKTQKI